MRLCQVFSQDTENFADAHLDAIKYAVVTKERIELFQGLFVAAIFLCSAVLVNSGKMSKGQAAGLIQVVIVGYMGHVYGHMDAT
jgi:hypothetical protein